MQSETHNPKHFPENVYRADPGTGGTRKLTCKGTAAGSDTLPNPLGRHSPPGGSRGDPALLEAQTRLVIVLELYSLHAGAGVALVAAQALHAAPLVRVAHAAAAPVQVAREIVCAFNVHVDFFCGEDKRHG